MYCLAIEIIFDSMSMINHLRLRFADKHPSSFCRLPDARLAKRQRAQYDGLHRVEFLTVLVVPKSDCLGAGE